MYWLNFDDVDLRCKDADTDRGRPTVYTNPEIDLLFR